MESNFNIYLFLIILIAVIFFLLRMLFKIIFKSKNLKLILFSITTIATIVLSWMLNLGWIRLIFAIPILIHLSIFLNSIYFSFENTEKNKKTLTLFILNIATFYLGYILLPDGGDTNDSERMFFGLIDNEKIISFFWGLSQMLILTNFGLLIYQYIIRKKINDKPK